MATRRKSVWYALGLNVGPRASHATTVFTYNGTAYTNETADALSATTADVPLSNANDGALYIGVEDDGLFSGVRIQLSTAANLGAGTRVWEYSTGPGTWASLTYTLLNGTVGLTQSTTLSFDPPSDWANSTVNGTSGRWIRLRNSGALTNGGTISYLYITRPVTLSATIDIAETDSRSFVSAIVQWTAHCPDIAATSFQTLTTAYLKIGAGTRFLAYHENGQHILGAEVVGLIGQLPDQSAAFNTSFTGTSHVVSLDLGVGAAASAGSTASPPMYNLSAHLILTYDYDDTSEATRTKTVFIPFDCNDVTGLGTSLGEIATVPALDSYLPEASKTIKQTYFIIDGNPHVANTSTTDLQLSVALDAEGATAFGALDNAGASSPSLRWLWVKTFTTNATHSFKAACPNTNGAYRNLSVMLVVTYTYDESSSTSIMNSVLLPLARPFPGNDQPIAFTGGSSTKLLLHGLLNVQEANPTLVTFGLWARHIMSSRNDGPRSLQIEFNGSYRTVTPTNNATYCGYSPFCHVPSSGVSLARGINRWVVTQYSDGVYEGQLAWGMLVINYTSNKHSDGSEVHNKTLWYHAWASYYTNGARGPSETSWPAEGINFPETSYYLSNWSIYAQTSGWGTLPVFIQCAADEGVGAGYIFEDVAPLGVGEYSSSWFAVDLSGRLRRFPSDVDQVIPKRLDARAARTMDFSSPMITSVSYGVNTMLTYHSILTTISGTVSGYADADGAGLTVRVYRQSDRRQVAEVTTTAGGAWSATVYDDTEEYFAVCHEDATHVGVSVSAVPA